MFKSFGRQPTTYPFLSSQPVNLKGNQPWIFIGRTDAEAEVFFGHPMWTDNSLEKSLMLGKIEGRRRRGLQRMRWLASILISGFQPPGLWEINIWHWSHSVQLDQSLILSDSLRLHGVQHTRLPCPSLTPIACSNSYPSSQWCHPTISSSVIPFSSCLKSFSASGSFLMSQFLASGGQNTGASASASVVPMNMQDWFPLGLTGLISLQSKGLSRVFSKTAVQKHQFFGTQLSSQSNSHIHTWPLGKPQLWQDGPLSAM